MAGLITMDEHKAAAGSSTCQQTRPDRGARIASLLSAARQGSEVALGSGRWLLNPGSVGQPRDGDPRAAYLLLEANGRASFRRVAYPVAETQAEVREKGLPDALAERLAHGL